MPVQKKTTLRRNVSKGEKLRTAVIKAQMLAADSSVNKRYSYPIRAPKLAPGVVPEGVAAPVLAMDTTVQEFLNSGFPGGGFPGFPILAQLATRPEYRAFASAIATELTREWIEFTSSQDDGSDSSDKIKAIEAEFKRLNVRETVQRAAEHDSFFGRGQLFIELKDADRKTPLILDKRTVKVGSLSRIVAVEAMWTTPVAYNALDPVAPDFYKPSRWFMLGNEVHASRLLTIVTRPLPDMLKPAFNFAGMSMSQLAEPYVENWLRTRQSVADLINNFSITAIATSMDQVLQGNDDGADLFARADLFTATRSNKGLMLLDKEREELIQVNTPLSGLHELQAQSQEHMCSVSRTPAIILTGISPSGLNASSEGEIRVFYDWIAAQQEAYWRAPLEIILKVVQLSLFGEIDDDIGFKFIPLYQMTPKEESEIRTADGATDVAYVTAGVLDPSEVRDKLAKDPSSGYQGLDLSVEIMPPEAAASEPPPAGLGQDKADFKEGEHPRDKSGKFGSGSGGGAPSKSENIRSNGLSPDEQKIESDFHDAIDANAPALIQQYKSTFGNVIDPDQVKALNPKFKENPDLAAAVHEPSSRLAKMIYTDALKAKAAAGDTSPTVFLAGGSGSGKSTTKGTALGLLGADPDGLIYDSVLSSPASAKSRIDEALAVTKGPIGIAYTNANIDQALLQNAMRDRSVSIDTLAHAGASDTLRELAEHYKDNPRVKFTVMNNLGGLADVAPGSIDDVPKYEKYTLRKQLVDTAKSLLDTGVINKKKYEHLVK